LPGSLSPLLPLSLRDSQRARKVHIKFTSIDMINLIRREVSWLRAIHDVDSQSAHRRHHASDLAISGIVS